MVFSGVLQKLRNKGYEVILGVTNAVTIRDEDIYRLKDFSIIKLELQQSGLLSPISRILDKLSHKVMRDLMSLEHPCITLSQTRLNRWRSQRKEPILRRGYALGLFWFGLRWHHVAKVSVCWSSHKLFGKILDDIKPVAIIFSSMLIGSADYLKESRRRSIINILDVPSWDNPTSKGPLSIIPDAALAWSENMKAELVAYHSICSEKVHACGVLAYDSYFHPVSISSEQLRKSLGIPNEKAIILYALGTPNQASCMSIFIAKILDLIRKGNLNAVLVVRISPRDEGMLMRQFNSDPLLFINRPSGSKCLETTNWMPDENEALERVSLVRSSSVVVAIQSSMVLEACCSDRPVINLAYDAGLNVPPEQSVERFYKYTHALPVIETGGAWIVRSDDELLLALKSYLATPEIHQKNRRELLEHACQYADGLSACRWVEAVDKIISNH